MWRKRNSLFIVFTKADKLGKSTLQKNIAAYKKELLGWWEELPEMIISSAETKLGREEILKLITENKKFFIVSEKTVEEKTESDDLNHLENLQDQVD